MGAAGADGDRPRWNVLVWTPVGAFIGGRLHLARHPGAQIIQRAGLSVSVAINALTRGRWRPRGGADTSDHSRMDGAVIVGAGSRHRDCATGRTRRNVAGVDAAIVEHNAMGDVVVVLERDLLAAEAPRVRGKRLRPALAVDRNRRAVRGGGSCGSAASARERRHHAEEGRGSHQPQSHFQSFTVRMLSGRPKQDRDQREGVEIGGSEVS